MKNPEIIIQLVIQKFKEPEGVSYHVDIIGDPTLQEKQQLLGIAETIIKHQD